MKEFRCKFCHKLLGKYHIADFKVGEVTIEIKCDKCKTVQDWKVDIGTVSTPQGEMTVP